MWNAIKNKWNNSNGAGKTLIVVGAFVAVFIIGVIVQMYRDISNGIAMKKKPAETKVMAGTQEDIANKNLEQTLNNFIQQYNQDKLRAEQKQKNNGLDPEETKRMIAEEVAKQQAVWNEKATSQKQNEFNTPGSASGEEQNAFNQAPGQESQFSDSSTDTVDGKVSSRMGTISGSGQRKQNSTEDNKNYLPPGTILSYVLLTGVNAPTNIDTTSRGENEHPPMVLMAIKGKAILPNGFRMDLSDCFATASVYGQYSDSRVVGRPKTLSCVREDGKAVEAKIVGQITGEDGKLGWQGKTVSRLGKDMHNLFKVGVMETISSTLNSAANGVSFNIGSSSGSSGNTRTQVNLGSSAAQSAAKATSRAFEHMADRFAKQADQVFPVIVVNPLRTGEIQLQEGVSLEFSKDVR